MKFATMALIGVSTLGLAQPLLAQDPSAGTQPSDQAGTTTEEIVVSGVRGALKEAVEIERQAVTVVSVITADDAGQFADQNVAESLQRIPGVTIERTEGEGRTIQVRGLNSDFNQVVINGAQIGSSNPDGGRSVSLDIISSDLLSGIQVAKSLTPDMDQDSLGAQVNLLTLSAFDRDGTTGRLRAEIGQTEYANDPSYRFTGDFTTRLLDDTLGIAVAATYSLRNIQSTEVRSPDPNGCCIDDDGDPRAVPFTDSDLTTPPNPVLVSEPVLVPRIIDQRLKQNERERIGGTFQIDYRPDDDNRWSLTLIGAQLKDADIRQQNEWEVGQTEITAAATGTARYKTRLERQTFFQDSTDRVWGGNFAGSNTFDSVTLSYGADYSKNRFTLPNGLRGRFATPNDIPIEVVFNESDAIVNVLDPGVSAPNLARYNQLLVIDETRTDEIWSAFANIEKRFQFGDNEASIKAGGKYRERTKVIRRGEDSINPTNSTNRPAIDAAGIPRDLSGYELNRPFNANFPGYFLFADPDVLRPVFEETRTVLDLQPVDERRDFDFSEKILAGYVQGQIDFGSNVTLIGGVRFERTQFVSSGLVAEVIELDGDELDRPDQDDPTSVATERTDWFPSIHLRADLTDEIVGRLSYSRGQVRPTFGDARNFQEIETTQVTVDGEVQTIERVVEGGNPLLDPLIADQFDATIGWYPSPRTSITAAAFYKDLKNPFISATFTGADVAAFGLTPLDPATGVGFSEADTVVNGGSGSLLGVEFGVNQFFSGALEGFFLTGNLTLIEGKARSTVIRDNETLRLEDQANVVANVSGGFENDRVTARVSATYTGNRIEGFDTTTEVLDTIRSPFLIVDANFRFNATEYLQLYLDIVNITNEVDFRYTRGIDGFGIVDRTSDFGRTFQLGALMNF